MMDSRELDSDKGGKPEAGTFEARLARVEGLVHALESDETPLEEALTRFEEAKKLLASLYRELTSMEQRIEKLTKEGEIVAEGGTAPTSAQSRERASAEKDDQGIPS
jgi:exodeoxyribonuclease VII small subunit